jgi:hypothetical protein
VQDDHRVILFENQQELVEEEYAMAGHGGEAG